MKSRITRRAALATIGAGAGATVVPAAAFPVTAGDEKLLALERDWLAVRATMSDRSRQYWAAEAQMPAWARHGPTNHGGESGWADVSALPEFRGHIGPLLSSRPNLKEVRSYNRRQADLVAESTLPVVDEQDPRYASPGERANRLLNEFNKSVNRLLNEVNKSVASPKEYAKRQAEGRDRVRAWIKRQREKRAWYRRVGLEDWDAREKPLYERMDRAETCIMNTPASGPAGMAVKLRMYARLTGADDDIQSVADNDLEWDQRFVRNVLRDAERLAGGAS